MKPTARAAASSEACAAAACSAQAQGSVVVYGVLDLALVKPSGGRTTHTTPQTSVAKPGQTAVVRRGDTLYLQ